MILLIVTTYILIHILLKVVMFHQNHQTQNNRINHHTNNPQINLHLHQNPIHPNQVIIVQPVYPDQAHQVQVVHPVMVHQVQVVRVIPNQMKIYS